ncbi:hypothetical protein CA600_08420 [Paenibacillus sp. VTT E-133280]|uniref:hypothetical protein n=1 Tax=unclassified Paenibacillus TaxID=185978 RepID=UPI000BA15956|nr:hypothetical protein [Paenibacillus sp. VTT E-133280]OZQ67691.1 hypothetical protein CA600_08420 [Paenibacillus sp. VTT E-133280]
MAILFFDMLRNKIDTTKAEAAVRRAEKQDNKRFRQAQTFSDRQITISTKAELEDAVSKRYGNIIVVGELAENVGRAYKVKDKLGLLEKTPTVQPQVGFLGITETVIITAIVALTVVLVVAMLKNYSIDTDIEMSDANPKIKLRLNK